ncbi:MAG: 16S rRNA (adenine(1518)-N(6)/adenine(1519)-N(6))-dimethyltransferase RsmA [Nitrospiraceae bacterium]|nr:16S rRNA (adenine(1518)-N(6)/adenine(1519)-N(6))-dimethyltransferase RsmA [Nitrospiraceae bacterium]
MKPRLSQNFLFDPSILRRIADAAGISPEDTVVEIGPGLGTLTKELLQRAARVIAIELDEKLYLNLKEKIDSDRFEVFHADALRFPYNGLGPFKVVSNIPYHITTPVIFRLLEEKGLKSMTLTIQKEVAQRIAARPGGKDYGILSLAVQYRGAPRIALTIPKGAFRPVPKVDSACISIDIYERPPVEVHDEHLLFSLIRGSFSYRRKTIENGIKKICPGAAEALKNAGIDPKRRPETLGLAEFARLTEEVLKTNRS